tara:strand:+ start:1576 stop:2085 length:510 start_codon:yes stop_codon:yes gene_type:complete
MKKIFILLLLLLNSCSQFNQPNIKINLPSGYEIEQSSDPYNILTAYKHSEGEVVSMIEIKYSDDWSFSQFSNEEYVREALNTNSIEDAASIMFKNFRVSIKKEMYFKNLGNCFYLVYSGENYENGVRVTNLVVQFIKNNKLFTLVGSALPSTFPGEHKQFLNSFETISF